MPIALRNAPKTFQEPSNSIFWECIDEFLVIYLNRILIYSDTRVDCIRHLHAAWTKIKGNKLYVGSENCKLIQKEFPGIILENNRTNLGEDRKRLICEWHNLRTTAGIFSFSGIVKFFWGFIHDLSRIAALLITLTRKTSRILKWEEKCNKNFETTKQLWWLIS